MREAFICEGWRTPIGRYGGALAHVRPDDMLAGVIRELVAPFKGLQVDECLIGCANQAGEDNRNVARMATLLAGLGEDVPGATINRLCGSGLDAVGSAARAVKLGEAEVVIAGGVESMSRAPLVMPKADAAFSRKAEIYDTTIGWRFVNRAMHKQFGTDSMPETAENVAEDFNIGREDQDKFALRSQERAAAAIASGRMSREIKPVTIPQRKGDPIVVDTDEHPRATTLEKLAKLPAPFREGGSVTAGNASGVNDGAAALIVASEAAVRKYGLTPIARVTSMATVGVPPRIMGIGPAPATQALLDRHDLKIGDIDFIELNEAFAAQGLATMRQLGLPDDAEHVNPHGGAIALGHPLGMSGARLALTNAITMSENDAKRAICTMCIGVGQGIALLMEAV
ncbi:3-oxoadipyl-CoA thiolase [Lutimaribacter sp. EGI FJ00015]|uniref:3-oxoadipyl-CoA thiolase n=1 Tax=Lutimaribacter degradans TaxID=2945989 RepID=A0ACC5ZV76_9RHOB|nr:3-oxoadipyl-CoA thiolase [Lutimaribacter sp. EGI FJ00013]MCM2561459.1 3-oxoadipyl-CoA thiolase [Lutimaribacter sp. EGI FJ00013]MCO0612830.1 3-oxoadipyl-CoA thiolase [Lutimaribacter sp. EGI FJ00015]MCO0635488.1 3-oxoadipyl-CoA thiolase [Lutimaribacter sp. EGI FJ00014]